MFNQTPTPTRHTPVRGNHAQIIATGKGESRSTAIVAEAVMAGGTVSMFLKLVCLIFLLSSSAYTADVLGSICAGECSCELGETCTFAVNVSATLQLVYQLNETTENQVSR